MAYPAAAIANEILKLANKSRRELTPMQMQKLVYFAHGWNLALAGEPLINERVEAWDYGPVVKALYRELREYGSHPITKPIIEPDWEQLDFSSKAPSIDDGPDPETNEFTKALVEKIWDTYGKYNAFELSEMTHVPESPWSRARRCGHQFIPDDEIREYFKGLNGLRDEQSATLNC
jgi:uncharacterized phage-associated protein